jgi:hypothetical protein
MKKKLIKFLVIPLTVFVISLFVVPAYLLAGPDDTLAEALDAPSGAEGDITSGASDSDQATTFSSFGNINPLSGPDFTFLTTGDAQDNESGASNSLDWGSDGTPSDWVGLDVDNITAPKGAKSFSFDYYFMSSEPDPYDYFTVQLFGSSDVPDGTQIAYAENFTDVSYEGYDMDGTAFEDGNSSGWVKVKEPVDPGDNLSFVFFITDTVDGIYDSAVILDNFKFQRKKKDPEPVVVRTMSLTCANVWINEDNNFEFVFFYEYKNNNWVKIYDMAGVEVFSIDMPYGAANFVAALPDGMYTVRTFHEEGRIIQEFPIGKPAQER